MSVTIMLLDWKGKIVGFGLSWRQEISLPDSSQAEIGEAARATLFWDGSMEASRFIHDENVFLLSNKKG